MKCFVALNSLGIAFLRPQHIDSIQRALRAHTHIHTQLRTGSLKRGAPEMSEHLVLMRALRDMNLPKFVYDDVPLFLGLVNDLFPGRLCDPLCSSAYGARAPPAAALTSSCDMQRTLGLGPLTTKPCPATIGVTAFKGNVQAL